MIEALKELEENISQIAAWLDANKKIINTQKYWLSLVINKIINSENITEDELNATEVYKDNLSKHKITIPDFYRLNNDFSYFATWLKAHHGLVLPDNEKQRLCDILHSIDNMEEYSQEEVSVLLYKS